MKDMLRLGDGLRRSHAGKSGILPTRIDELTESQRIALSHRFGGDRKAMREAAIRLARFAAPHIPEHTTG
jgi:hypothetical protein